MTEGDIEQLQLERDTARLQRDAAWDEIDKLQVALKEEREACAQLAENLFGDEECDEVLWACKQISAAIRGR